MRRVVVSDGGGSFSAALESRAHAASALPPTRAAPVPSVRSSSCLLVLSGRSPDRLEPRRIKQSNGRPHASAIFHTDFVDIWSVGHGARPLEELIATLRGPDIQTLVDVRSQPGSRRHPQFGAQALAAALGDVGIGYEHLPELGGRREAREDSPHRALRVRAFRGYADHMSTDEFARGYERLVSHARQSRAAFMCAETLWWRCHRRLIADRLTVDGWQVTHLFAPGKSEPHVLWGAARTLDGNLVYDAGTLPLPT